MKLEDSFPRRLYLHATSKHKRNELFARVWTSGKGIEHQLTFNEFSAAVSFGASYFDRNFGIKLGDRVAILSKGTLNFYIALVSLQWLGATPVLLNWRQPIDNLLAMVQDAGAIAVATAIPFSHVAYELKLPVVDLDTSDWCWQKVSSFHFVQDFSAADEAIVFFSSGSTNRPKPILHTNKTLLWTADKFPLKKGTMSTLCFMPNFHVLQTFQNFLLCLARGIVCSIHGDDATKIITPHLLLAACKDIKPDTVDTVPFIMNEWSTLSQSELVPLTRCFAVRSGGAPLSMPVASRLMNAGIHVQIHYGQTEAPGMQLLTVPGAQPQELATFLPPWSDVEVKLDEASGELLIKGCGGSSPGYLKDGRLVSRQEGGGWHRTGDIFRWSETTSGLRGLNYVMRIDDVILLSTGEMFNPLPLEAAIETSANLSGPKLKGLVVIGQNRPTPFLLIEPAADSPYTADEVTEMLRPAVESANVHQVEYARIRPGHVIVLKSDEEPLPYSAKGNVIRHKAESAFSEKLSSKTHAEGVVISETLAARMSAAGHNDVHKYITEHGVADLETIGIDSLGVASLMNSKQREAERVGMNVKAWIITCVVSTHWYSPKMLMYDTGNGALDIFYGAAIAGKYSAVSWLVQYLVTTSCFITGFFQSSMTASMIALFFSIGWSDSFRDRGLNAIKPPRMSRLGMRESTIVILLIFYKTFVYLASICAFKHAWKPKRLNQPAPLIVAWYLYALLYYRCFTLFMHRFLAWIPPIVHTICAIILVALINEGGENQFACPFCTIPLPFKRLNVALSFLFDSDTNLVVRSCLPESGSGDYDLWPNDTALSIGVFASESLSTGFRWLEPKVLVFYPSWLFGYYYGDVITSWIRAQLRNAVWCVIEALTINMLFETLVIAWIGHGFFNQGGHLNRVEGPKEDFDGASSWVWPVSDWIWESSTEVQTISFWNPRFARILYLTFEWIMSSVVALLILGACTAVPWSAQRCGNAALGKYLFMQIQPTIMYAWLCYLASYLGEHFGSSNLIIQLLQLVLLIGWPFFFVYFIGPLYTAVIMSVPRFVIWICAQRQPQRALDEATHYAFNFPSEVSWWWSRYFTEINRDFRVIHKWSVEVSSETYRLLRCTIRDMRHYLMNIRARNEDVRKPLLAQTSTNGQKFTGTYLGVVQFLHLLPPITSSSMAILSPVIRREFDCSMSASSAVLAISWITTACTMASFGHLQMAHSRRVVKLGLIGFFVSSALAALSHGTSTILLARAFTGIAIGFIKLALRHMSQDMTLDADPMVTAMKMATVSLSPIVAAAILAIFGEQVGWRAVFAVIGNFALLCLARVDYLDWQNPMKLDVPVIGVLEPQQPNSVESLCENVSRLLTSRLYWGPLGLMLIMASCSASILTLFPYAAESIASTAPLGGLVLASLISLSGAPLGLLSLSTIRVTLFNEPLVSIRYLMIIPYTTLSFFLIVSVFCSPQILKNINAPFRGTATPMPILLAVFLSALTHAMNFVLDAAAQNLYLRHLGPKLEPLGRNLSEVLRSLVMSIASALSFLTMTKKSPQSIYATLTISTTVAMCWYWIVLGVVPLSGCAFYATATKLTACDSLLLHPDEESLDYEEHVLILQSKRSKRPSSSVYTSYGDHHLFSDNDDDDDGMNDSSSSCSI